MLWLHTPSPAPNLLHIVSLRATDGSGHRTPPTHLSGTLLVGVSAPSMDPSGKSHSTSSKVNSARVDQATFSSESGAPASKGVTAPTGVATRKSWLQCTVLHFLPHPSLHMWVHHLQLGRQPHSQSHSTGP